MNEKQEKLKINRCKYCKWTTTVSSLEKCPQCGADFKPFEKQYKAVFVLEETHEKFAKEAHDDGRTFDKFLNILLELWKSNELRKNKRK